CRRLLVSIVRSVVSADHVVCVSEATRRDLERLVGVAPSKTSVIHNCLRGHLTLLDAEAARADLRVDDLRAKPRMVLMLCDSFYKNRPAAIRAFGAAADRLPKDSVL